jgi:hypothetical protein
MLCLWIIVLGLANFIAYTIAYSFLEGDARNGGVEKGRYYLRGHFIHGVSGGEPKQTSPAVWIYSYIHSISIWPTTAALLLSTLILARPHIMATMREGFVSGQTLIAVFGTVIVLITALLTAWFIRDFIQELTKASGGP